MQTIDTPKSSGSIALRQGLIFGVGLAIVEIIIGAINAFVLSKNGASTFLSIGSFVISLAAYFFAGFMASKQTGRVGTGALAGMWTGLFSGILNMIFGLIIFFTVTINTITQALQNSPTSSNVSADTIKTVAIVAAVAFLVIWNLLAMGIGAGVGAIGGVVGKNQAPAPVAPTYTQPY